MDNAGNRRESGNGDGRRSDRGEGHYHSNGGQAPGSGGGAPPGGSGNGGDDGDRNDKDRHPVDHTSTKEQKEEEKRKKAKQEKAKEKTLLKKIKDEEKYGYVAKDEDFKDSDDDNPGARGPPRVPWDDGDDGGSDKDEDDDDGSSDSGSSSDEDDAPGVRESSRGASRTILARYREADSITVPPLPTIGNFQEWKTAVFQNTCAASGRGDAVYPWITACADSGKYSYGALRKCGSAYCSLDAKLAVALSKVIKPNARLSRQVQNCFTRASKEQRRQ